MSDHEDSLTNSSIFSVAEQQQLKRQIALSSPELIQLTYNEEKFNGKLDGFNKMATRLIEEEKYEQAGIYLDQAEKVLEYAAGCGKTIERTLITTILNNQACMLQRNSQFEQSANYLEAIIFNITQFIEGSNTFAPSQAVLNKQSGEFTQLSTYFERKASLALYQLRFCALSSHVKKNQTALRSARKALNLLKNLCGQEYLYEFFTDKASPKPMENSSKSQQFLKLKTILKQLSSIKDIEEGCVDNTEKYIQKAIREISKYNKKTMYYSSLSGSLFSEFQNYSIGNLMQASPTEINTKPNYSEFMSSEISNKGKIYKIIHLAMAHFTVATQLRLISANKYALDDEERHSSQQFRESKLYHLLALIIISRNLPSKSVFFTHAISSFKNHYGIDLLERAEQAESFECQSSFSVASYEEEVMEVSRMEEGHTYEEQNNKSIQIHEAENIKGNQLAFNMLSSQYNAALGSTGSGSHFNNASPIIRQNFMKEISNSNKFQGKKVRQLKSRSKNGTSFSRLVEGSKTQRFGQTSKNKENKSKSKTILQSKGRETIKSRRKDLKTEPDDQNKRTVYYGYPDKSRSKSKKNIIERKNSKKGLGIKGSHAFENKKIKNEVKVNEQYGDIGVKSKHKNMKNSHGLDEDHIQMTKSHTKQGDLIKMKKLKSPGRGKNQPGAKRKSVSKDRYF